MQLLFGLVLMSIIICLVESSKDKFNVIVNTSLSKNKVKMLNIQYNKAKFT